MPLCSDIQFKMRAALEKQLQRTAYALDLREDRYTINAQLPSAIGWRLGKLLLIELFIIRRDRIRWSTTQLDRIDVLSKHLNQRLWFHIEDVSVWPADQMPVRLLSNVDNLTFVKYFQSTKISDKESLIKGRVPWFLARLESFYLVAISKRPAEYITEPIVYRETIRPFFPDDIGEQMFPPIGSPHDEHNIRRAIMASRMRCIEQKMSAHPSGQLQYVNLQGFWVDHESQTYVVEGESAIRGDGRRFPLVINNDFIFWGSDRQYLLLWTNLNEVRWIDCIQRQSDLEWCRSKPRTVSKEPKGISASRPPPKYRIRNGIQVCIGDRDSDVEPIGTKSESDQEAERTAELVESMNLKRTQTDTVQNTAAPISKRSRGLEEM